MKYSLIFSIAASVICGVLGEDIIKVNSPNGKEYLVAGQPFTIKWDVGNNAPDKMAVYITNSNGKPFGGEYALNSTVDTSLKTASVANVSEQWVGEGWKIVIKKAAGANGEQIGSSDTFSIKPAGTSPADQSSDKNSTSNSKPSNAFNAIPNWSWTFVGLSSLVLFE